MSATASVQRETNVGMCQNSVPLNSRQMENGYSSTQNMYKYVSS